MERKNTSLTLNVIWNGILSLSQILFPLITFPYITRILGVEVNGANSFSLSVVNYFSLFASLGMSTYGVKACAQAKEDRKELSKTVHELLLINTISAVIILVVLYCCIVVIPAFHNYAMLMTIYSANIVLNIIGMNWMFQGIEKFKYITTRSIIFKIISILFMLLFVKSPKDGALYAAISVFASYGGNIINLVYSKKFIDYYFIGKYKIKRHIKPLLYLFSTALAVNIYSHMDSVMIGLFHGDYDTGIYYVAVKVKTILITLVSSFSVVMMSRLSNISLSGEKDVMGLLHKSYSIIALIAMPVVMFFIICAPESVLFLSGEAYIESVTPMRILMPSILISALSQIIGNQYSVSIGKEKNLMIAVIFGAITNLIVNLILIPKMSYNGAAIGTAVAESTQCIIQIFLAKNMVMQVFDIRKMIKVTIGTLIASVCLLGLRVTIIFSNMFFSLVFYICSFFTVYFIIMMVQQYDVLILALNVIMKKMKKRIR